MSKKTKMKHIKVFSCRASIKLAGKICEKLNIPIGKSHVAVYSDGEFQPRILESVSGKDVYVIQSLTSPESILEMVLIGNALVSAKKRTLVLTYYGYARQDRKDRPGVPIGAKAIAKLIEAAGYNKVVCLDLHAEQIEGFFSIPVKHGSAGVMFVEYIKSLNLENVLIASPDNGGTKRASEYSKALGIEMITCYKFRPKDNEVSEIKILGDVKDKNVILVDDLIDTASSITKVADKMIEEGALSVRAFITHPVLSGGAYSNIEKSKLVELVTTDSIPLKDPSQFIDYEKSTRKIKVLSLDEMLASVIKRLHKNKGLDSHFNLRRYETS